MHHNIQKENQSNSDLVDMEHLG